MQARVGGRLRHHADVGLLVEYVGEDSGRVVDADREGEARLAGLHGGENRDRVHGAVGADAKQAAGGDAAVGQYVADATDGPVELLRRREQGFPRRREPDPPRAPLEQRMPGGGLEVAHLGRERRLADAGVTCGEREAAGGGDAMEGHDVVQIHR